VQDQDDASEAEAEREKTSFLQECISDVPGRVFERWYDYTQYMYILHVFFYWRETLLF